METPVKAALSADPRKRPSLATRVRLTLMDQGTAVLVMVIILLAWEAAVRLLKVPQFVLPGPFEIVQRMVVDWRLILTHASATVEETMVGFAVSALIGIPLAIGIVYSPLFEKVTYTVIVSLQTIPKVALAPILVLWFVLICCVVVGSLASATSPLAAVAAHLPVSDKVLHFAAYLALAMLPVIGFRNRRRGVVAGLSMIVLGVLLEAGQYFSVGRAVEAGRPGRERDWRRLRGGVWLSAPYARHDTAVRFRSAALKAAIARHPKRGWP